jgi:hypothetical protein
MVEAFLRRAEACGRGALVNQIGGTFSAITAKTWGGFRALRLPRLTPTALKGAVGSQRR